ncbi:hypothetical protein [Streptomyces sp. NPDC002580]|uniref:hypothetical protein n=1 Tax=Streptomyces sp. NPDC002580 TaxID=3364653 RepID=UPI0036B934D1
MTRAGRAYGPPGALGRETTGVETIGVETIGVETIGLEAGIGTEKPDRPGRAERRSAPKCLIS